MIETNDNKPGRPLKPTMVKDVIMNTYSGNKLEILPDGWQIWNK